MNGLSPDAAGVTFSGAPDAAGVTVSCATITLWGVV